MFTGNESPMAIVIRMSESESGNSLANGRLTIDPTYNVGYVRDVREGLHRLWGDAVAGVSPSLVEPMLRLPLFGGEHFIPRG